MSLLTHGRMVLLPLLVLLLLSLLKDVTHQVKAQQQPVVEQTLPPIPPYMQLADPPDGSGDPANTRVISVDSIYTFNFTLWTNQYLEVIRLLSNETYSLEQTDLFSLDVDYSIDALKELIEYEYCQNIRNTLPSLCTQALETLIHRFRDYSERESYEVKRLIHAANVVNAGFFRRMDDNKPIVDANDERSRPYLPDNHFYFSKKGKPNLTKNLAGDLAVVVSGYWPVAINKYTSTDEIDDGITTSKEKYFRWFQHSLKINMPYIIFTDVDILPEIVVVREHLPTLLVALEAYSTFHTSIQHYPSTWIHPKHVPSVEVAKIWLQKMNLVYLAFQLYPHQDYYIWIDAAITSYRNKDPPSPYEFSKEVLLSLPSQRISYSMVRGEYHSFAATVMIFPKQIVVLAHHLFYQAFETCSREIQDWRCGSEQYLWTTVREKYPELFHPMSYDYGEIDFLWGSNR